MTAPRTALVLRDRMAEAVLLLVTAIWGTSFVAVQDAIGVLPTMPVVAWRFGIASIALLPTLIRHRPRPKTIVQGMALGALLFLGFALQTAALTHTTAARAAFGTSLSTVLVPTLAFFLWRQAWPFGTWAALFASLLGAYALTTGSASGDNTRLGDLLSLGCALAFTGHIVLQARIAKDAETWPLLTVQVGSCALYSAAAARISEQTLPAHLTITLWATLLYLGLFTTALCLWGQLYAQARTSATRTAFILALEPVFAAAFAWALRGQSLTPQEMLGGSFLVVAALLAERALPPNLRGRLHELAAPLVKRK